MLQLSAEEAEARAKKANEDADKVKAGLDEASKSLKDAEGAAGKIMAEALAKLATAEGAGAEAKAKADEIVKAAVHSAETVKAKAEQEIKAAMEEAAIKAAAAVQSAEADVVWVRSQADAARVELAALKAKQGDAVKELADVNAQIASIKEAAKKISG